MTEHYDPRSDAVLAALAQIGDDGRAFVHERACAMEWSDDGESVTVPCSCSPQVLSRGTG